MADTKTPKTPESAHLFGRQLLRAAEMQWLAEQPMQNPDRLGRYASLYLEEKEEGAVALCLLDRRYHLMCVHLLTSGPKKLLAEYVPRIPVLFRDADAAYAAVFMAPCAAQYGYTGEDEDRAARIEQYCKLKKIPMLECIVAGLNWYLALFREFGHQR